MTDNPMCLVYGGVISFAVSLLKRIGFIKNNPKIVAFILNILSVTIMQYWNNRNPGTVLDWSVFVQCVLEQMSASVATHEIITEPIKSQIKD